MPIPGDAVDRRDIVLPGFHEDAGPIERLGRERGGHAVAPRHAPTGDDGLQQDALRGRLLQRCQHILLKQRTLLPVSCNPSSSPVPDTSLGGGRVPLGRQDISPATAYPPMTGRPDFLLRRVSSGMIQRGVLPCNAVSDVMFPTEKRGPGLDRCRGAACCAPTLTASCRPGPILRMGLRRRSPFLQLAGRGDYDWAVRRTSRQAPGANPVAFLNARLNAASES